MSNHAVEPIRCLFKLGSVFPIIETKQYHLSDSSRPLLKYKVAIIKVVAMCIMYSSEICTMSHTKINPKFFIFWLVAVTNDIPLCYLGLPTDGESSNLVALWHLAIGLVVWEDLMAVYWSFHHLTSGSPKNVYLDLASPGGNRSLSARCSFNPSEVGFIMWMRITVPNAVKLGWICPLRICLTRFYSQTWGPTETSKTDFVNCFDTWNQEIFHWIVSCLGRNGEADWPRLQFLIKSCALLHQIDPRCWNFDHRVSVVERLDTYLETHKLFRPM